MRGWSTMSQGKSESMERMVETLTVLRVPWTTLLCCLIRLFDR